MSRRIALVTCADLPDLDPDDRLLLAHLAWYGVTVVPAVWDDPAVDWSVYDLVVLRSPWDYTTRRDEFVAWATGLPHLANPGDVVAWNTDKRYLAELATAGVPTVPTDWLVPDQPWSPPASGEFVLKPAVGAGGVDTGRYDLATCEHRDLAAAHVRRLHDTDRTVMLQPYLGAIDSYGETALVYLGGEYSHAIRKGPMLTGPDTGDAGLYRPETITPRVPTYSEREVAERVLAAVPGGAGRLLYARVDLTFGPDDRPVLVELELTEPSLFLGTAEGAPGRLATAISQRLATTPTR